MPDKIETLEQARELLAEYDKLPDDLTARLNWDGYNRLPEYVIECVCGQKSKLQLGIDEIRLMVKKQEFKTYSYRDDCSHNDPPDDDE